MKARFVWIRQGELPSYDPKSHKDPDKMVRVLRLK